MAETKRRVMEATLSSERRQWRKREAEIEAALKEKDALNEDRDAQLRKWEKRKHVINHYMSIVEPMSKSVVFLICTR